MSRIAQFAFGVVAASLFGTAAAADEPAHPGTNKASQAATATEATERVDSVATAYALAKWGQAHASADALIVAARMLSETPVVEKPAGGTIEPLPGASAPTAAPPAAGEVLTKATMLADARRLARGDKATLARIAAVEGLATKGVVDGPLRMVRDIPAQATWWVDVTARGNEPLRLAAVADGATNIGMQLVDENGNVVCDANYGGAQTGCAVSPVWTGRFRINITNYGSVWTRAVVVSN